VSHVNVPVENPVNAVQAHTSDAAAAKALVVGRGNTAQARTNPQPQLAGVHSLLVSAITAFSAVSSLLLISCDAKMLEAVCLIHVAAFHILHRCYETLQSHVRHPERDLSSLCICACADAVGLSMCEDTDEPSGKLLCRLGHVACFL
jgi:hypothetical protein